MKKLIASLLMLLSQVTLADSHVFDQLDWELNKTKKDIQVLSAEVPGSQFRAYQAITRVEASISDLVAIIRNPATCTDWVYRCGESYRYTQESPNVDLVYTASKMPFPVQDRDTLARIEWQQDPETDVVTAIGVATSDILAPSDSHVRILEATVVWELHPQADGKTLVKTYGHADPGGELPVWLINQLSTEVPVKTLNNLKKLAAANPPASADRFAIRVAIN